MSAYSTLSITKQDCIALIIRELPNATDEQLEDMAQQLDGERHLINFKIVADYENDDWPNQYGRPQKHV